MYVSENAIEYSKMHKKFYYFKALIYLHKAGYLNDYFQFNKGNDRFISMENNYKTCPQEKKILLKHEQSTKDEVKELELTVHIMEMKPGYIDLTYNEKKKRYVGLISD